MSSYLSKVDGLLTQSSVETFNEGELVRSELPASTSIQKRIHKLTVILSKAALISNVEEFTLQGLAQIDLVSERVAQLHSYKFAIPGPLYVLLAVAVRVGVGLKRELSPDGVFS